MMNTRTILCAAASFLAACAHASNPVLQPETSARIADPLRPGDCLEARRRAALQPDLEVDRLPAPVVMRPAPFRDVPTSALRKDGSAEIKIDVLVDTLGRADLGTFKVVKVSNKWFTTNVRS